MISFELRLLSMGRAMLVHKIERRGKDWVRVPVLHSLTVDEPFTGRVDENIGYEVHEPRDPEVDGAFAATMTLELANTLPAGHALCALRALDSAHGKVYAPAPLRLDNRPGRRAVPLLIQPEVVTWIIRADIPLAAQ